MQAVYISGNVRNPFRYFMDDRQARYNMSWEGLNSPKPDYLSSSRKRLVPQLLYKGTILRSWNKKIAVVTQTAFFDTLPSLPEVSREEAEVCWLLYDLQPQAQGMNSLVLNRRIFTKFWPALNIITTPKIGKVEDLIGVLQARLDAKHSGSPPETVDSPNPFSG